MKVVLTDSLLVHARPLGLTAFTVLVRLLQLSPGKPFRHTVREIGALVGLGPSAVHRSLLLLSDRGYAHYRPGRGRAESEIDILPFAEWPSIDDSDWGAHTVVFSCGTQVEHNVSVSAGQGQCGDESETYTKTIDTNRPIGLNVSDESLSCARLLGKLIVANYEAKGGWVPKLKPDGWAVDIQRLHVIDGAGYEDIESVIRWCQADEFWWTNIRSGSKLRKQFPRLIVEAKKHTQPKVLYERP